VDDPDSSNPRLDTSNRRGVARMVGSGQASRMSALPPGVIHVETMELEAKPSQVREFILTPERILDYYPQPVEGGVLEAGQAFFCRGEMGVSLLERDEQQSTDRCTVLKVTTAIGHAGPCTREAIESNSTFSMIEDWDLAESDTGTTLTKIWRDIVTEGPEPFPIVDAVREGAIHETETLIRAWNAAARES
jgi:hypothetical protein